MYIKKLELQNFQKHSKLTLDFTDRINILYGESDIGKSCIVRAIQWVFFNQPKGDDIRKERTKRTTVRVTLDNDVIIEKIKSNSINAYKLYINEEIKEFNAIGKDIPEEVKQYLGVSSVSIAGEELILNIANQMELSFLLGYSSTTRSKIFNKLTDTDIIDKSLQSFNKDILRNNKDIKEELKRTQDLGNKCNEIQNSIKEKKLIIEALSDKIKTYEVLETKITNLKNIKVNIEDINRKLDNKVITTIELSNINIIKENNIKMDNLISLKQKLKENTDKLETVETSLIQYKPCNIDLQALDDKAVKVKSLMTINTALKEIDNKLQTIESSIPNLNKELIDLQAQYENLFKQMGKCPLCKTEITEEIIQKNKL